MTIVDNMGPRLFEMRKRGETGRKSWKEIAEEFPEYSPNTLRGMLAKWKAKREPSATIEIPAEYLAEMPDGAEVWEAAKREFKKKQKRHTAVPKVIFNGGPVCIVNAADLHLGSGGVDLDRLEAEVRIVNETPGMYLALAGDLLDNFIIGRLRDLQMFSHFRPDEEWAMVAHFFTLIKPGKLLWSAIGNHDDWTRLVAGVDYFAQMHEVMKPVIIGREALLVDVVLPRFTSRWKIRHKWSGYSMYNPTHAQERAAKFEKGVEFDIGVGAHTHTGGYAREFNNGGKTGIAIQCGTYKVYDAFAERMGFYEDNASTAVAVIVDDCGAMASSNLEFARRYMEATYGEDDDD